MVTCNVSVEGESRSNFFQLGSSIADGQRLWTVDLAERQQGQVRLAVQFQQRFDEDEPQDYALPIVQAQDVTYQTSVVAVEGSAEFDVELPQHRGQHINDRHGRGHAFRLTARNTDNQGNMELLRPDPVVAELLVLPQPFAVISDNDHDRVVPEPLLFQPFEQLADLGIGVADLTVIAVDLGTRLPIGIGAAFSPFFLQNLALCNVRIEILVRGEHGVVRL